MRILELESRVTEIKYSLDGVTSWYNVAEQEWVDWKELSTEILQSSEQKEKTSKKNEQNFRFCFDSTQWQTNKKPELEPVGDWHQIPNVFVVKVPGREEKEKEQTAEEITFKMSQTG